MRKPASSCSTSPSPRPAPFRAASASSTPPGCGRGSPCQQDGFGALELLRLAVDHDDVAVAQYGLSGGLTAEDALTPDAGEGNLDSTAVDIAQGAAHRPRPWRDHH